MPQTFIICRSCGSSFEIARHRALRWIAAGVGAVVGGAVTESFIGALLSGAAFYAGAAAYDEHRVRHCPSCGAVAWRMSRATADGEREKAEATAAS